MVSLIATRTGPRVVLPWNNEVINSNWTIGLTPNTPLILKVETGVSESTLNLEGLKVTNLSLNVGVGRATIHLPAAGRVTASINGGVGQLEILLSRSMQARVRVNRGIGAVRVLGDFQRGGDTYTSSGYAGASDRVDLQIEGGSGQITVEQAKR